MKDLIVFIIAAVGMIVISCSERPATIQDTEVVEASVEHLKELEESHDELHATNSKPVSELSNTLIYNLSQVDELPMFGEPCNKKDTQKCNQENIRTFIKENIELPSQASINSYSGLEHVKVVIQTDGTIGDLKYVSTKKDNCSWCQQTAVDVVGKMTDWKPAIKDGKTVPVEIVIPIRFVG